MNICFAVRALPIHNNGGMEKHTLTLAEGLARKGHTIHIITTAHPSHIPYEQRGNIHIYYLGGTTPGGYSPSFWKLINQKIGELNAEHSFDIIHFQGFAGLTYGSRLNAKYVVTIHGTLFSETLLYYPLFKQYNLFKKIAMLYRYKIRLLLYPFYKLMLRKAYRIIVDSNFTKIELEGQYRELHQKIDVVQLGLGFEDIAIPTKQEARKKLGLSEDDFIFFTVCRIDETKGIQIALSAINSLKEKNDKMLYLIGGKGPQKEELENYCRENKLENVRFLGYIEEKDLPDYYAAADIFLHPEVTAPAFGLVMIEAMRCGTPVLGSQRGAIPEIVQENVGWLFKPCDSIDLANKIHYLLHNPTEVAEKSKITKQYVENNFSAERMVDEVLDVYEKIVNE